MRMIGKSMPSGHDPMGRNRFSDKIMRKIMNQGVF
jgi:hypothetical protein